MRLRKKPMTLLSVSGIAIGVALLVAGCVFGCRGVHVAYCEMRRGAGHSCEINGDYFFWLLVPGLGWLTFLDAFPGCLPILPGFALLLIALLARSREATEENLSVDEL